MEKNNQIGVWGLPGTFPTQDVQFAIHEFYEGAAAYELSREFINTVYFQYKDAVLNEGFKKYGDNTGKKNSTELVEFIGSQTGYDLAGIRRVLLFIKDMAAAGDIPNQYYTIESAPTGAGDIVNKPLKFLEKQATTIKWIAIAGILGVGLYFTWPLLVKGRRKLNRTRTRRK